MDKFYNIGSRKVLHSDRLLKSLVKIFIGEVCGLLRKKIIQLFKNQKVQNIKEEGRRFVSE
jgi:hypothetical protein